MTEDDVRALLKAKAQPTQLAFAKATGVSAQYVNDVLQGHRAPGEIILDALGLEKIVTYRKKAKSNA